MKKLSLLLSFFLFFRFSTVQAQIPVIEVDTSTNRPKEQLPFDKEFFLKQKIDVEKVYRIELVPHTGNLSLNETIQKHLLKNSLYSFPPPLRESAYSIKTEGKIKYLYIFIPDTLALKPSRKYSIIITQSPDKRIFQAFDLVNDWYKLTAPESDVTLLKKAQAKITEVVEEVYDQYGFHLMAPDVASADSLKNKFNASLKKQYNKIDSTSAALQSKIQIGVTRFYLPITSSVNLKNLSTLLEIDTLKNSGLRDMLQKDSYSLVRSLNQLTYSDQAAFKEILGGLKPINCQFCEKIDGTNFSARSKNIKSTAEDLTRISVIIRMVPRLAATYTVDLQTLQDLLTELIGTEAIIAKQIKLRNSLIDEISKLVDYQSTATTSGNSNINTLEARAKNIVVPEFGLVSNWPFQSFRSSTTNTTGTNNSNYALVPYLGVTFNFRPINKDISFRSIRNTRHYEWEEAPPGKSATIKRIWYGRALLQRLSVSIGYSLVSFAEDNRRADFFSKSAFLTGINYRLGSVVKLTTGRVWFYNIPSSTEGLQLTSSQYWGLSVDFVLKDAFNGFLDLVTTPFRKVSVPAKE